MKKWNGLKGSFLIGAIGTFGITLWRYAHGDSLNIVFLDAFLTTIWFLIFIYLDLKKGA